MLRKTENLWKIVGCFWTWQNGVFWVCFFWGFSVIVVCFWCVWHSSRSVKNACFFPSFLGFSGVVSSCLFLGLEGLGVFVFLVFLVFVFGICFAFVSVLFALFWFCCWIVFGVGSWFVFVFVFLFVLSVFCSCLFFFLLFCFFWRFKGQVRWPEGPPHLALNPPYFLFLFFLFCFLLFCFFGGFKGQVRWPNGPPHLALNPPYFLFVFVLIYSCFCIFVFITIEKTCFSPKKGHFCC